MLKEVDTPYVAGLTLGADPLVSGVALVSALENRDGKCTDCKKRGKRSWYTEHGYEGLLPPEKTEITVLKRM